MFVFTGHPAHACRLSTNDRLKLAGTELLAVVIEDESAAGDIPLALTTVGDVGVAVLPTRSGDASRGKTGKSASGRSGRVKSGDGVGDDDDGDDDDMAVDDAFMTDLEATEVSGIEPRTIHMFVI